MFDVFFDLKLKIYMYTELPLYLESINEFLLKLSLFEHKIPHFFYEGIHVLIMIILVKIQNTFKDISDQ